MNAVELKPVRVTAPYDVAARRAEFPLLARPVRDKPLVYLDNAATTQKPLAVLEALDRYYREHNANVHRGVHWLSEQATADFEGARETLRAFINGASVREVIFTRGTTEAINLVAQSWGRANLRPGDEILVSTLEHHSNIVPWQMVAAATGARVVVAPMLDDGALDLAALESLLNPRTRMVAVGHVSNALGTVNPVARIAAAARVHGALTLVDGAQAAPHLAIDVQALGCDFYAISAHKMYGPTGVGLLWGREALLKAMPPWQGGGDMIKAVSFSGTVYNDLPWKFEAGTPDIAGVIGFGAAARYLVALGLERIAAHEHALLLHGSQRLQEIPGLRLVGTAPGKAAVLSFVMAGVHPHDIGTIVDAEGVAIRTGHHCAMPVMERLGLPATARASLGLYNSIEDLDRLVAALHSVREVLL